MLSLIKGLGAGGAEHLLLDQLVNRDRESFENHVAFWVPYKDLVVERIEAAGVPVTCLDAERISQLRWVPALRRLLDDFDPDVVHFHSPSLAGLVRPYLAARRRRPAIVYTEHNRWGRYRVPTRLANRMTYRLNDGTVAVSAGVAESIDARHREGVEVILNGIDVDSARSKADRAGVRAELGLADDEVAIVNVANLRREKDYPNLLRAAAIVRATEPRARFFAVGQGPLAEELDGIHAELGLGDGFRFLGYRSDAIRVASGCDIFTMSSLHEGFPLAMMEAMAVGLPVVATAVGGIPEAIEDGVQGRLVEPSDPEALASALLDVVTDDVRRAQLAAAATERGGSFDSVPAIARLEDIYRRVATARRG